MLWQCLQIERSSLYDQNRKTYHYHRNTCGSISRFAVIICLFCGKIQHLQLFFFVPCIFELFAFELCVFPRNNCDSRLHQTTAQSAMIVTACAR